MTPSSDPERISCVVGGRRDPQDSDVWKRDGTGRDPVRDTSVLDLSLVVGVVTDTSVPMFSSLRGSEVVLHHRRRNLSTT